MPFRVHYILKHQYDAPASLSKSGKTSEADKIETAHSPACPPPSLPGMLPVTSCCTCSPCRLSDMTARAGKSPYKETPPSSPAFSSAPKNESGYLQASASGGAKARLAATARFPTPDGSPAPSPCAAGSRYEERASEKKSTIETAAPAMEEAMANTENPVTNT